MRKKLEFERRRKTTLKSAVSVTACLVAITIIATVAVAIGSIYFGADATVYAINKAPKDMSGAYRYERIMNIEQFYHCFQYYFVSDLQIDTKEYKKTHPKDVIIIGYLGAGEIKTEIFSDNMPDPRFFKKWKWGTMPK